VRIYIARTAACRGRDEANEINRRLLLLLPVIKMMLHSLTVAVTIELHEIPSIYTEL